MATTTVTTTELGSAGIRRLRVRNFHSLRRAQMDFGNLVVFVGPNAAGKSNILDALRFLADCMVAPLRSALEFRGGIEALRYRGPDTDHVELGVTLALADPQAEGGGWLAEYEFALTAPTGQDYHVSWERCEIRPVGAVQPDPGFSFERSEQRLSGQGVALPQVAPNPHGLLLPFLAGAFPWLHVDRALSRLYVYDIHPHEMRGLNDVERVGAAPMLHPDGINAAEILLRLQHERPEDYRRLNQLLSAAVPQVATVFAQRYGPKVGIAVRQTSPKNEVFEARDISDGTLRLLGMLLALFQPVAPFAVAIEEPETLLHPSAMGVMWDALTTARTRMQVLVTTHSPEVLDNKDLPPEALRLVTWSRGATRIGELDEQTARALARHELTAGDLLRANALLPATP